MNSKNQCKRCGKCCESIDVYKDDIDIICNYIINHRDILKQIQLKNINEEKCIFLIEDNNMSTNCLIYNLGIRPSICDIYGCEGYECSICGKVSQKYTQDAAESILSEKEGMADYNLNNIVAKLITTMR